MNVRAIYIVPGVVDESKAMADAARLASGDLRTAAVPVEVHFHRAGYGQLCNERCYIQKQAEPQAGEEVK